jgi:hypothetical protein
MLVSLFENKSECCPFDHQLWPGRAQVSWKPCICAPAREAALRGRGMGHAMVTCSACHDRLRRTTFYEPAHDSGHRSLTGWMTAADPQHSNPCRAVGIGGVHSIGPRCLWIPRSGTPACSAMLKAGEDRSPPAALAGFAFESSYPGGVLKGGSYAIFRSSPGPLRRKRFLL